MICVGVHGVTKRLISWIPRPFVNAKDSWCGEIKFFVL